MSEWPTVVRVLSPMKGTSDGHLVTASDGAFYVIKHSRGPLKERLLVNEVFAAALARRVGLPVPVACPIIVPASLVREGSDSCLGPPWTPGLHCGSAFVGLCAYDYLPESLLPRVRNQEAAPGCWLFDVWTGNADQTQVVFYRRWRERKVRLAKIDHGWCFGTDEWIARDLRRDILRWQRSSMNRSGFTRSLFTPYLKRIEALSRAEIADCAATVPTQWLATDQDREEFERLVSLLAHRAANLDVHGQTCWPDTQRRQGAAMATCAR